MALAREIEDDVTGEEIDLVISTPEGSVKILSCESADWAEAQEKEPSYGIGGKGLPKGRKRGKISYDGTLKVKEINAALLVPPDDWAGGQGVVRSFFIGGKEYKSLLELRNMTLEFRNPPQSGTSIIRKFSNVEFKSNKGSISLGDSVGRDLEWDALRGEGLI